MALRATYFQTNLLMDPVGSFFHQELNKEGPRVLGGHYFTKKWQIYYPNFQHPKFQKKLDLGFDMSLTHDMTFLAFV